MLSRASCIAWNTRALALSTTVLLGSTLATGETATTTVKALTAAPLRYANLPVTVRGRFRGRQVRAQDATLLPLARSRWDFLLEMDDAAVWVSGIRPAGWDFDLDPRSPADATTGQWLEVTGTLRVERRGTETCRAACQQVRQVWIEASDLRRASPSSEAAGVTQLGRHQPALVFQDPIPGEQDVPRETAVRLQFSRAVVPETLLEHLRISYASPRPIGAPPIPQFTARYAYDTRSITLSFAEPLAPLSAVSIELLPGIAGENGLPVDPARYTFTTAR